MVALALRAQHKYLTVCYRGNLANYLEHLLPRLALMEDFSDAGGLS